MRTFDFTPLYRSTVGFDRMFDRLESGIRPDWPPYDIERTGDGTYRISMAVAGFLSDELELSQQGNTLLVNGNKAGEGNARSEFLHRGIANRSFRQSFSLADHVRVADATLKDGLLLIRLVAEVPEELRPRRIPIGTSSAPAYAQDNEPPKQISQDARAA